MSEQQKHSNPYSLTDIEQYLQGKLSPSAMHELEKAALQDPFLADAIEGFREAEMIQVKDDLANIHQQLLSGKQINAETITAGTKQNNWFRIAALFILLAGMGISAWFLMNRTVETNETAKQPVNANKKDSLSAITVMDKRKDTVVIGARKPDSLLLKTGIAKTTQLFHADSIVNSSKSLLAANGTMGISSLQKNESSSSDIQKSIPVATLGNISGFNGKQGDDSVFLSLKDNTMVANKSATINIQDTLSLHIPFVKIGAAKDPLYYTYTTSPKNTTGVRGTLALVGGVSFGGLSAVAASSQPALNKTEASQNTLDEIVVTGYPVQKKKEATGSITSGTSSKNDTLLIGAGKMPEIKPVGGMKAFSDYLINQLINKADLKKEPGKFGAISVRLGFDENGKITKVKIKRSFDKKFNPLLIKAFIEGPLWIIPKKEKTDFDLTLLL